MYKSIKELKNKHQGEDIWILLAGSSMNYVNNSFFENKITVGQNQMFKHFNNILYDLPNYLVNFDYSPI